MVKTKVYFKPNMSETTSYIKLVVLDLFAFILNAHLFVKISPRVIYITECFYLFFFLFQVF